MNAYHTYTDAQLLQLLNSGDEAAFSELYQRYRAMLARYALQVTGDTEDASDMVQEIFVSVWNRRLQITVEHSFKAYLYKSVRNTAARYIQNNIRRQQFLEGLSLALQNVTADSPDTLLEARQIHQQVEQLVAAMPEKMKAVYILSREEQLSHKEISIRLNIAEATVKKHVQNALKIIKAEVPKYSAILLLGIGKLFE